MKSNIRLEGIVNPGQMTWICEFLGDSFSDSIPWDSSPSNHHLPWEPKGTPPMPRIPEEIAGLTKGLLTIGFP